jgi:putative transposase
VILLANKLIVKVNPKHTSQKCQNCGHIDQENRDGEKFICTNCGFFAHADINAAKNIRDKAYSTVLRDSEELEPKGSKRPKQRKEISSRSMSKRGEPGNPSNRDIKAARS